MFARVGSFHDRVEAREIVGPGLQVGPFAQQRLSFYLDQYLGPGASTNREAFENLFAILARSAKMQGPAAAPTALSAAVQTTVTSGATASARG